MATTGFRSPLDIIDGAQLGANKLCMAMKLAFDARVGEKFGFIEEPMEQFMDCSSLLPAKGGSLTFSKNEYDDAAMEPAPKRYHSEELINLTCQESMVEATAESQAVVDNVPAPLPGIPPGLDELMPCYIFVRM